MFESPRAPTSVPQETVPLAVVVVNWNGKEVLQDCFGSLREEDYPGLRLIMVDNGSEDDSVAWTRSRFPEVEIIATGQNLRWAAGNNQALTRLAGEGYDGYILLLNNDTIVPQGSLRYLVSALAECPEAWAATPRICYADDPARAWYDGGTIGRRSGWVGHQGIRQLTGHLDGANRFVDYGTGCALLLAPQVASRVGLLDEDFYFYAEDADYSLRIRKAGGKILHAPRSLVLHKVSMSVGGHTPRKVWLRSRSHVRLLKKHWPKSMWPALVICQAAYFAGHGLYHLWGGRPATAWAVWQGALDELAGRDHE